MKDFQVETIPIKDSGYNRQMSSKALLANDLRALNAYNDRKKMADISTKTAEETIALKEKINNIESDLVEIKALLKKLIT